MTCLYQCWWSTDVNGICCWHGVFSGPPWGENPPSLARPPVAILPGNLSLLRWNGQPSVAEMVQHLQDDIKMIWLKVLKWLYIMYLNMFESFWILNFPQFNWILLFMGIIVQIGCQIQSLGTQNKLCLSIVGHSDRSRRYESHRLWGTYIVIIYVTINAFSAHVFVGAVVTVVLYWRKSPVLVKQYSTTAPKKRLPRGPPWLSQA